MHYLIHKNVINELILTFDSIPKTEYFKISRSMDKDKLNIVYYSHMMHIDQSFSNNADTLRKLSKTINIDNEKISRTVRLIYNSKVISISSSNRPNRIEMKHRSRILSIFALSENDYGYVFYPDKYDRTKKIDKCIYYSNSIQ